MGSVEAFSVTCATCQTRLKVRDAAAVGKILPCPRCGSMVLVAPDGQPLATNPIGETVAPSSGLGAAHADAPSADAATQGPASPALPKGFESTGELPRFDFDPHQAPAALNTAFPGLANLQTAKSAPSDRRAVAKHHALGGPVDAPLAPGQQWTSPESQELRRWLLIGFAGLVGVVLVIALVGFWMAQQQQGAGSATNQSSAASQGPRAATGEAAQAPAIGVDHAGGGEPGLLADGPAAAPNESTAASDPADPADSTDSEVESGSSVAADGSATTRPPALSGEEPILPGTNGPTLAGDVPPGLAAPRIGQLGGEGLSQALGELEKLVGAAPQIELMQEDPRDFEFAVYSPEHALFAGASRLAPPAPRRIDMQRQWRLPIQFQTPAMPLAEFARLLAQLSNVPVAIDVDALVGLGMVPSIPVSAGQASGPLDQVVASVLEPLGLALALEAQYALITAANVPPMQEKVIELPQSVLAGTQQLQLEQWVRELVLHPHELIEGVVQLRRNQLSVQLPPAAILRVESFIQQLAAARELAADSARTDPTLQLSYVKAREALNQRLTINRSLKTGFQSLVDEIALKGQITLLIDWASIAPLGWNPDSEFTLVCQDEPMTLALALLLIPMELDYYVVDGDLIVISTADFVQRRREVNFHRVADLVAQGADPPTLIRAVRFRLGEENFDTALSPWRIEYDAASQSLIASQPQRAQILTAAMLATLRGRLRPN